MRYRLIIATVAEALVLAILVVHLIGVEWLWVILNGVMQHELR